MRACEQLLATWRRRETHLITLSQLAAHLLQVVVEGLVRPHRRVLLQLCACLVLEVLLVHVDARLVLEHEGKGKEHGVVRHVGAAQVEEPGDLVEHAGHVALGPRALARQLGTHGAHLLRRRRAGVGDGQREDGRTRLRRAPFCPELIDKVLRDGDEA